MLAIFEGLLSNLIVASLIAVLAIALSRYWRNAVLLHLLWLLVLIKLFTPPLVPLPCLPDWSTAVVQLENESDANIQLQPAGDDLEQRPSNPLQVTQRVADVNEDVSSQIQSQTTDQRRQSAIANTPVAETSVEATGAHMPFPLSWTNCILLVWLVGSGVIVLRSTTGIVRFFRHLKYATEASDKLKILTASRCNAVGIKRIPRVMLLPGSVAPMIWAPFQKSYLLLPKDLIANIDSEKLDALITHEIGHLYLRHHWVRRFELLVTVFFWWCPLVWFAKSKLREYEEEICDAWVVQTIPGIEEAYAHALVDTVKFLSGPQFQLPPAAVGNNHFHFLNRRITMIMQNESQFRLSLTGWLVAIAVMLFGLPFSPSAAEAATTTINTSSNAARAVDRPNRADDDRDDDWDEDDDWDSEDGRDDDDDMDDEDRDPVEEIIEEITEGLTEMNEEILEAIEEAREEIHEEISEAPEEVLVALSEINLDEVVEEALADAPKMVHLFVDEVDPASVIAEIIEGADINSDDLDDEVLDSVRSKITNELSSHIAQLSRHSKNQITDVRRQIKRGLAEVPPTVRQQIVEANLPGMVDRITKDSHPVVRQFVKEVQLRDTLKNAIRSAAEGKTTVRRSTIHRRSHKADSKRIRNSKESSRAELEQRLADLMDQVEMIRRELKQLQDSDR